MCQWRARPVASGTGNRCSLPRLLARPVLRVTDAQLSPRRACESCVFLGESDTCKRC